ncbi:MAG: DUF362 domain-containing protein, partial [Gemmatimonadota bacterium]
MRFPDEATIAPTFHEVEFPSFARVAYEPDQPELEDVEGATRAALDELVTGLQAGASVAVGVGSRGIHDVATVAAET